VGLEPKYLDLELVPQAKVVCIVEGYLWGQAKRPKRAFLARGRGDNRASQPQVVVGHARQVD